MIARNGKSYVERLGIDNAATAADEAVRLDQVQVALSGVADLLPGLTLPAASITDFAAAVDAEIVSYIVDSDEITWLLSGGKRYAKIRLRTGGGLTVDTDGLGVDTGTSGVSMAGHTHAQLHDPATVTDTPSLNLSISGQEISGNVVIKAGGGLAIGTEGVEVDYGQSGVAPNVHTHAQLHDELTKADTNSVSLTLTGQLLEADVRLKTDGGLLEDTDGLYVDIGPSGTQVAAGNHTHGEASRLVAGFLSAEDKRKIDVTAILFNADQAVTFTRPDLFQEGEYVGGRVRWGQSMNILGVDVVAKTPPVSACWLGIEIDGVVMDTVQLPGGSGEVVNYKLINPALAVEQDKYLRILCLSGVGDSDYEAHTIDVSLTVRPAIADAPSLQVNSGGSATGTWLADGYHNSVGSNGSTTHAIDTSGVTDPAPDAVYQSWRGKYSDSADLVYTLPGLIRGIDYTVRLHFCQNYFNSVGNEIMSLYVTGESIATEPAYDILAETGAKFKAAVWETSMAPNASGEIEVRVRPQPGTSSLLNLSICGIEILPV